MFDLFKSFSQNEFAIVTFVSLLIIIPIVALLVVNGICTITYRLRRKLCRANNSQKVAPRQLFVIKAAAGVFAFLQFLIAIGMIVVAVVAISSAYQRQKADAEIWQTYAAYQAGEIGYEEWQTTYGSEVPTSQDP